MLQDFTNETARERAIRIVLGVNAAHLGFTLGGVPGTFLGVFGLIMFLGGVAGPVKAMVKAVARRQKRSPCKHFQAHLRGSRHKPARRA